MSALRTRRAMVPMMPMMPMMLAMLAAPVAHAAPPLVIHYNERPPHHYTQRGMPTGDAVIKVADALKAAGIPYEMRATPAKQQLVILRANEEQACMLGWVGLPGRERAGKLSQIVYQDQARGRDQGSGDDTGRRLWCTMSVPDQTMQRLNAALLK